MQPPEMQPLPAPPDLSRLRVWLVHDWLTGMRGGERVLLELVGMFPRARIATLLHVKGSVAPKIEARVAKVSFLQHVPRIGRIYRNLLPLMPAAARSLELDPDCDVVISSSHCVAKAVRPPSGVPHICYCHTPMRYIWGLEDAYLPPGWSLKRTALGLVKPMLRDFDVSSNDTISRFVANSRNVAARIERIYARPAAVVPPGIDETYWTPPPEADAPPGRAPYYLVVSALVPYKRVDLAIRALAHTGRRLVIIGRGREQARLRKLAGVSSGVEFLGWQPDDAIRWHYQHCQALLFPGEEDFGITPLEAMACGRPVIAYRRGGATETITAATGEFFDESTPDALRAAIDRAHLRSFDPAVIRARALEFTWQRFRQGIAEVLRQTLPHS